MTTFRVTSVSGATWPPVVIPRLTPNTCSCRRASVRGFQRTSSPDAGESARGPARQETHEHASLSELAQAVKR